MSSLQSQILTTWRLSGNVYASSTPACGRLPTRHCLFRACSTSVRLYARICTTLGLYARACVVVDKALEVVEEYQGKILKLERDVLVRPKMRTVTARASSCGSYAIQCRIHSTRLIVHMLQGDLSLHKRTLEPVKTLVYGLRRYDADRAAAILASEGKGWDAVARPVGFMSEKSKTYLVCQHSRSVSSNQG